MIINTPIGNLEIKDNGKAITSIQITEKFSDEEYPSELQRKCACQLNEFFNGNRKEFDLPLEFTGTNFQKNVWNALLAIPFGATISYGGIAKNIGSPKAARAVGGACNANPILVVVPCHRVVGANGKLVGFACGIDIKSQLLNHEKCEVTDV